MIPTFITSIPPTTRNQCSSFLGVTRRRPNSRIFLPSLKSNRTTNVPKMQSVNTVPSTSTVVLNEESFSSETLSMADSVLSIFASFFMAMTASWNSERTYHYMQDPPEKVYSQTTFDVRRLTDSEISDVLASNGSTTSSFADFQISATHGFNVSFLTKMGEKEELVRSSTNLAFVPEAIQDGRILKGSYFRDLGYEEAAPIRASFEFDVSTMQLVMTTFYTKVVSVDQITLVDPELRLRRIINYARSSFGQPAQEALLVGLGIEKKSQGQRLVS